MATCRCSQPIPRFRIIPTWWPVMRWPTPAMRPSFLGVDMDQFARPLALVSDYGRPGVEGGQQAEPAPSQHDADGGQRPAQLAADRRPVSARSGVAAQGLDLVLRMPGQRFGLRCGRDERSASPASPSAAKRSRHLRTVRTVTPSAAATAAAVQLPPNDAPSAFDYDA